MDAPGDEVPRHSDPALRVHANAMRGHGGPYDLALDFGYRAAPDSEPEVQVRVTMSWEHAATMVKALQGLVDAYEAQVGPIPDVHRLREEEE